jgi:hypothetical protein
MSWLNNSDLNELAEDSEAIDGISLMNVRQEYPLN